ncbi:hypothetical protein DRO66_07265 [Candidatus Bathyarchaeota archaeon]|nr:MAG: hypothetical protein DRO66_07265 [Candidatus Bathyarchaeota archaeon]
MASFDVIVIGYRGPTPSVDKWGVFEIQEKVIENILLSFDRKIALEKIPRTLDPIQQTISTTIQTYINYPEIDRNNATNAIKFLNEPKLAVQIKELRGLYKDFESCADTKGSRKDNRKLASTQRVHLGRGDLHLICFVFNFIEVLQSK